MIFKKKGGFIFWLEVRKLFWKPNENWLKGKFGFFADFQSNVYKKCFGVVPVRCWSGLTREILWQTPITSDFFPWLWIFSNSKTLQKDCLCSWERFIVKEKITGCWCLSKKFFINPYWCWTKDNPICFRTRCTEIQYGIRSGTGKNEYSVNENNFENNKVVWRKN